MEDFRPSRTALRVALRRAAHQVYDARPLVFDDPLAVAILGPAFSEELQKTQTRMHKPFSTAMRAFVVARSRYAEDCLSKAVSRGVRQYCLLGAGLDTFGCRNRNPGLRVFEVDHPATQRWKIGLLDRSHIPVPQTLTHVSVDFERQDLGERLLESGLDSALPTVFGWLGVVPYLSRKAFRSTVAFVQGCADGSGLIFDYAKPREALPPLERLAHDSLSARVALAGEPFQLFFRPEELVQELTDFQNLEDLGSAEINARFFDGRNDGLRVRGSGGRMLSAWKSVS